VMPGFPMLLFGFLPLGLLAWSGGRPSALAFAYGPLMLVRRDAYLAVDGHRSIAASAREDVDLARAMARSGRRVAVIGAADLGATRHDTEARAMVGAWRRILFAYSGDSLAVSITEILGTFLAWGLPLLLPLLGLATGDPLLLAGGLAALAMVVVARIALSVSQRMPLATIMWHPVTVSVTLGLQVAGLIVDLFGPPRARHGHLLPAASSGGPAVDVPFAAPSGTGTKSARKGMP